MMNCAYCQKRMLLKFIVAFYNISTAEIANSINVSDSLVRKHINGERNCALVDLYLINRCFGISERELSNAKS